MSNDAWPVPTATQRQELIRRAVSTPSRPWTRARRGTGGENLTEDPNGLVLMGTVSTIVDATDAPMLGPDIRGDIIEYVRQATLYAPGMAARIGQLERRVRELDAALVGIDNALQWIADNHPAALEDMPTALYDTFRDARTRAWRANARGSVITMCTTTARKTSLGCCRHHTWVSPESLWLSEQRRQYHWVCHRCSMVGERCRDSDSNRDEISLNGF